MDEIKIEIPKKVLREIMQNAHDIKNPKVDYDSNIEKMKTEVISQCRERGEDIINILERHGIEEYE